MEKQKSNFLYSFPSIFRFPENKFQKVNIFVAFVQQQTRLQISSDIIAIIKQNSIQ